MTAKEVMREFWRLCDLVTEAEQMQWEYVNELGERVVMIGLLSVEEGQAMRDRYRERADALLDAHRKQEKAGASVR